MTQSNDRQNRRGNPLASRRDFIKTTGQFAAASALAGLALDQTHLALSRALGEWIDVPPERRFLGFDGYRQAIDCLRPGDVAMLTTHAAFRAPHLEYAVEKGVNVFMEKDFAADPGGIQRILRAGEAAEKKNLSHSIQ